MEVPICAQSQRKPIISNIIVNITVKYNNKTNSYKRIIIEAKKSDDKNANKDKKTIVISGKIVLPKSDLKKTN